MEGLFIERGDPDLATHIRQLLDQHDHLLLSQPLGPEFTLPAADTLLLLLGSLASPIIPAKLYDGIMNTITVEDCKNVMLQLPPNNLNMFIYLLRFLREVLQCSNFNGVTIDQLALTFSNVLMPFTSGVTTNQAQVSRRQDFPLKRVEFLVQLLNSPVDLFPGVVLSSNEE
eukprot:TRINITY_DN5295_c0_g1_i1.p1 TRINITY_DN5295_c0_g1~~TRINITY_DN5295_c0_g1_i1.p1  ORF type:complete len:171 (+),score=27.01 TRINITY_DN5295_c0_g1_i1:223-735(+)